MDSGGPQITLETVNGSIAVREKMEETTLSPRVVYIS
jgi:DUF4097 and DUF4098 domain-containing protein YvlB